MSRLGGWLKSNSAKLTSNSTSNGTSNGSSNLAESEYLKDSMECAALIMNDNIDEAERRLNVSSTHIMMKEFLD